MLTDAGTLAAAWSLASYVDAALGQTNSVRDALYGSLLAALHLRLAEVRAAHIACAIRVECREFTRASCTAVVTGSG